MTGVCQETSLLISNIFINFRQNLPNNEKLPYDSLHFFIDKL